MGLWPFGRKKSDDMSVETLLDQANAASPTGPAPATAASVPGDATFRMPVEDIFTITGRGTVVTGRIESGAVRVGMQVNVVRAGAVATTTTVTGVEMFRKVLDTATVGDNVGLLLDRLTKQELQQGDVLEG
jgi:elongation factor Tu